MRMNVLSTTAAARHLGCSRASVQRSAKLLGLGIYTEAGRLVGLAPVDLDAVGGAIHDEPGNPEWIARRVPSTKGPVG